ncbi:hypothetical protein I656_00863 [Geobacillus sp. WSUCF1]|nr:hypothetical protein I656_00863 [Geobacillus sp. WSUCF1]
MRFPLLSAAINAKFFMSHYNPRLRICKDICLTIQKTASVSLPPSSIFLRFTKFL